MSQEGVVLDEGEFVLRRIHKNQVAAGPPITIGFPGFRPTPEDITGLSFCREKYISAAEVAASGRRPGEYYVVRLSVKVLRAMGLTILADERADGPAGHALIPELSLDAHKRDKAQSRELQVRLAELATENILIVPST